MTKVSTGRWAGPAVVAALAGAGLVAALTTSWGTRSAPYGDTPLAPTATQAGPTVPLTAAQLLGAAMTATSPQLSVGPDDSIGPWTAPAPTPPSTSAPGCDELLDLVESAAPATSTLDAPYRTTADDGKPVSGRLEVSAYASDQARDYFAKVKGEVAGCPKLLNAVSFTVQQVPVAADNPDDAVSFDLVGKGPKGPVEYRYDYVRAGTATVLLVEDGRLGREKMPIYLLGYQTMKLEIAESG
jgi:hypothetical protein